MLIRSKWFVLLLCMLMISTSFVVADDQSASILPEEDTVEFALINDNDVTAFTALAGDVDAGNAKALMLKQNAGSEEAITVDGEKQEPIGEEDVEKYIASVEEGKEYFLIEKKAFSKGFCVGSKKYAVNFKDTPKRHNKVRGGNLAIVEDNGAFYIEEDGIRKTFNDFKYNAKSATVEGKEITVAPVVITGRLYCVTKSNGGQLLVDKFAEMDGKKYRFASSRKGAALSGYFSCDGKKYIADDGGAIYRNTWIKGYSSPLNSKYKFNNENFYAANSGVLYKDGIRKIGKNYYAFKKSGRAAKGFATYRKTYKKGKKKITKKEKYFCSTKTPGKVRRKAGFFRYNGDRYYTNGKGLVQCDKNLIFKKKNRMYVLRSNGKVLRTSKEYGFKKFGKYKNPYKVIPSRKTGAIVYSQYKRAKQYGGKYTRVDISSQRLHFYINGKKQWTEKVTTGVWYASQKYHPEGNYRTPLGTFQVWKRYKRYDFGGSVARVAYLRFVPWNLVGIHDAPWQKWGFGTNRWIYDGSHGCVRMETQKRAKELRIRSSIPGNRGGSGMTVRVTM